MAIVTCLWFQGDLAAALERYGSLFDDFEVLFMQPTGPDTTPLFGSWRMNGTEFRAINEPQQWRFNESMSLSVSCADQAEVDKLWYGLIAGGGEESMCGWLTDPYGLSWQIVPERLGELMSDPNPARAAAARDCMLTQRRIVISELDAAADMSAPPS